MIGRRPFGLTDPAGAKSASDKNSDAPGLSRGRNVAIGLIANHIKLRRSKTTLLALKLLPCFRGLADALDEGRDAEVFCTLPLLFRCAFCQYPDID